MFHVYNTKTNLLIQYPIENIYSEIEGLDKVEEDLVKVFKENLSVFIKNIKIIRSKRSCFLNKKSATIKIDITSIQKLDLNDLTLYINKELLN